MLPVLVDMERLFEQFVFEWLRVHAPPGFTVRSQERVDLDLGHAVSLRIDITIEDARTGETICIVDTKYKADESDASHDLQQVVAYAAAKNCRTAVLSTPSRSEPRSGGHGVGRLTCGLWASDWTVTWRPRDGSS